MTRGRAATPDPFDIGAVSRSGELFDALAARKATDPGDDPAARLLAALVADVDMGAPPLPAPARVSRAKPGSRRRVVRTVVTLGVTAAVLTTAGAAAAGGGRDDGRGAAGGRASRVKVSERSNGSLQVSIPGRAIGRRPAATLESPESRTEDRHHGHLTTRTQDGGQRQRARRDHDDGESLPTSTPELQDADRADHPKEPVSPSSLPSPSPTPLQSP